MKLVLKWEELALFLLSIYALYTMHAQWWIFLLLFIGPDVSMLGYAAGNTAGAITYNLFHHKGVAVVVFMAGWVLENWGLQVTGIVLFGHSSMDRVFGYGLKYFEGFKFTHLGHIVKKAGM
ncbi:MAG TPA: DUF4260 domain-containing protein [Agriterribacter sp.]|nr:DUF4260 domain-containing protein [Agriterribacter sp.]